ncbi:glutaminase [Bradyrhizobium sp. AZCC 2230]|uniref:glutaminase n=1 Tax=Bradyrhizobium sp. AZCC 2230 TaxID=3117021 RepID=UPI002FEF84F4
MASRSAVEEREPAYVSTGHLPAPDNVQSLVNEAQRRFKSNRDGENSQVYPALARVPSELFGVCVVGTSGSVYGAGDVDYEFSIMSVSKPFLFALVCETIGPEEARAKLGANATGLAFNSLAAIEQGSGRTNPMVNAGAIATTSLAPGATAEARWKFIHDDLSRFAGRELPLNEEVYASASQTNFRNRSTARLFNLTVFFSAMLIVNFFDRLTPRQIGRYGFALCTIALVWLAFVVRNDWSEVPVLFGLVLFGIGQGSLVTLLFNVLVTASPKALAGDVGSLRGTTQNLAAALGTAVAGALLVGLLSSIALGKITASPVLTPELQAQVDLGNITFVSNDRLRSALERTNGTPEQVAEAVRVNTEARRRALKMGLLIMAGLALIAIIPAGRLPNYLPGEIPGDEAAAKT